MAVRFPNAVVVDVLAEHHIVVTVDHSEGRARYSCSCGVECNFPIEDLEFLRRLILETDSAQVLAWVEYPRE